MSARRYLRIASRQSPLARWQTNKIKCLLESHSPDIKTELLFFTTEGDKRTGHGPEKFSDNGKGLFVKELEMALLDGEADIAVHSMKDVPMSLENGLTLAAMDKREDPRDALISRQGTLLRELPPAAVVGSSSLRRQSQLLAARPDLSIRPLHGNIGTRLDKLYAGEYDAIILAAAGLARLGRSTCISEYFETAFFLPAPGQGALGVECRADDRPTLALLSSINHAPTYSSVSAERAFSRQLEGGCQTPVAAYAECQMSQMYLHGLVAKPDGSLLIRVKKCGPIDQAEILGLSAADELMELKVKRLLRDLSGPS